MKNIVPVYQKKKLLSPPILAIGGLCGVLAIQKYKKKQRLIAKRNRRKIVGHASENIKEPKHRKTFSIQGLREKQMELDNRYKSLGNLQREIHKDLTPHR